MNIKVALVEDDKELRSLLKAVLSSSSEISCIGAYPDATAFLGEFTSLDVDVVLMDINMPGMSGIECVSKAKNLKADVQFLMCTIYEDDEKIFQSICAGATGYILKKTPVNSMMEAIRDIYQGGSPMSGSIARKVLAAFQQKSQPTNAIELLSPRERELLQYLADGFRYKEIADKMFISVDTVRKHIHNIYEKLQVNSRIEALNKLFAYR